MQKNKQTPFREPTLQEQSFPLIAVIQLITFCVALVTCVNFKVLLQSFKEINPSQLDEVGFSTFMVALLGFLIGSAIGLGQIRKWRSMLFCGFAGAVACLLMLATCIAPAEPRQAIAACMLPLVTTLIMRSKTP